MDTIYRSYMHAQTYPACVRGYLTDGRAPRRTLQRARVFSIFSSRKKDAAFRAEPTCGGGGTSYRRATERRARKQKPKKQHITIATQNTHDLTTTTTTNETVIKCEHQHGAKTTKTTTNVESWVSLSAIPAHTTLCALYPGVEVGLQEYSGEFFGVVDDQL